VTGQYFRADVGGAAVLVGEQVVGVVVQNNGFLEGFKLQFCSERDLKKNVVLNFKKS